MKASWLVLCLFLAPVGLNAQRSETGLGESNVEILSDRLEFDPDSSVAFYRGNVRARTSRMQLTCETLTLTVTLPTADAHIENIVAEQNVVIGAIDSKGQTNRATGGKVTYTYKAGNTVTNELVELTGNPQLDTPQVTVKGDVIRWDFTSGRFTVPANGYTLFWMGPNRNTNLFPAAAGNLKP